MLVEILDEMGRRVSVPYSKIDRITENNKGMCILICEDEIIRTSNTYEEIKEAYHDAILNDITSLMLDDDEEV